MSLPLLCLLDIVAHRCSTPIIALAPYTSFPVAFLLSGSIPIPLLYNMPGRYLQGKAAQCNSIIGSTVAVNQHDHISCHSRRHSELSERRRCHGRTCDCSRPLWWFANNETTCTVCKYGTPLSESSTSDDVIWPDKFAVDEMLGDLIQDHPITEVAECM